MKLIVALVAAVAFGGCLDSRSGTVADVVDAADAADTSVTDTDAPLDVTDAVDTAEIADTVDAVDTVDAADTAVIDTSIADTTPGPCEGPLRISPRHGSTIGGDVVVAEGMEFYIGALTWMMKIGSADAVEMVYGAEAPTGPCTIAFRTPPNPPGTYNVYVYYGWGEPNGPAQREQGHAGSFTYDE